MLFVDQVCRPTIEKIRIGALAVQFAAWVTTYLSIGSHCRARAEVTIQELIEAYLNRPQVAARLASWDPLIGVLQDCHARIMEIWRKLEEAPPSPGYEPYLL